MLEQVLQITQQSAETHVLDAALLRYEVVE